MPQPPLETGSNTWLGRSVKLNEDAMEEILLLLGLDIRKKKEADRFAEAIKEIEKLLGFYSGAEMFFDNLPLPVNFEQESISIAKDAKKLSDDLNRLHPQIGAGIEKSGLNLARLEKDLVELMYVTGLLVELSSGKESRGRPRKEARSLLIRELRKVFSKYYVHNNVELSEKKDRSQRKHAEEALIETVLESANIGVPQNIRRMIDSPESTYPTEHQRVINEIYRKYKLRTKKI